MRARDSSRGPKRAQFSLTPPPMMNKSGHSSACRRASTSLTRPAHSSQPSSSAVRTRAEARCSASMPRISMWPNSLFGNRQPSWKIALPMPVPNVSIITVPPSSRPAPKRISARPAASASLMNTAARPVTSCMSAAPSVPIQAGSTFAAVQATPAFTTAGKAKPIGPGACGKAATTCRRTAAMAGGDDGDGVGKIRGSVSNAPLSTATTAALRLEPPVSMPSRIRSLTGCCWPAPPARHARAAAPVAASKAPRPGCRWRRCQP